ncbi:uncharacterized protein [Diadema setosum]|uniref:uncharacterized protein n=1 Tax=Diadema setosum TaxID=31175 RepID=UPI003B3BE9F7
MEIEKLHRIGESLGLSGSELREFIQEEQTRAREARVEERDRVKRELELTELNLQLERERQRGERDTGASRAHVRPPKLPTFEEGKDNLDTYLNRFERYATANEWPPATWATNLSALLSGKALDTYARLSEEEAVDYETLKEALLKRYDLTSEGFRRKLRAAKPESGETASQFVQRMRGYIDKWLTLGGFQRSYDDVVEIMLIEQFHRSCSKELSMFVREHKPTTLKELARVADRFLEAHSGWNQPQGGKTPVREKSLAPNPNSNIRPKTFNTGSRPPSAPRTGPESANRLGCRICGRIGHFARDCNRRNRPTEKLGAGVVKEERHQERSRDRRTDTMTSDDQPPSSQGPGELRSDVTVRVPRRGEGQVSNSTGSRSEHGCLLIDSCFSCDKGRQMRDERDDLPLMSAACGAQPIRAMPVAEGRVNGASVRVLRDSGCSTAVIRSELVRPEQMTDEWRTCVLIDGVRNPADPDEEWMPVELLEAVETRQQRREAARPLRALKVPGQVATVTPDEFRQEQETDPTLDIIRRHVTSGLQADVQRFCRSCDACQRAIPKGRVTKVPLGSTPVIDEPFHRVAVDLVGPIKPATTRGHRYILTLVDYATRYPEAVPLRNIDTPTVAEALLSIYSRVGFPKEMLTDRGAQFTSDIMREVSRLLSIRHVTTTPYHPQCNGLVERFNGTLKQMLNKMCEERPTDWDRYIDPLLFAYRETPQDSTGFAPFELLYGRVVRGPLMLVKELWTEENTEPETKSTYQFVLDLKEKMEKTCDIARNELLKSHERYRQNYNRKARQRSFKVGDEVLVLLPTDHNKLLMHWKGPFRVVGTVGKLDYRVDLGSRVTTFHANLLRKYIRREEQQEVGAPFEVASTSVVEDDDVNDDDDEERRKISNRMSNENLLHIPAVKRTQSVDDVNIDLTLTEEQRHQARELLQVFDDVLTDVPGITRAGHHDIQLTHNEPIRSKPYPLPHSMRQVVKDEVQEMMTLGVIEHSTSPYASPIVLVKKKDGTNRFCCDFRKLNAATIIDSEPIPDQEEIFAKLAGDRYFTKIDLTKGYWQVPLTERAKPLTAFITPDGLYQFMTMPFGLVNAPATFSRVMRTVLRGLPHVDNFIDDILIHTPTWEGHVEAVTSVLLRLRAANLKAKPSKCLVGYAELEFLGHRLSRGMVQPNHDKIAEIQNAKQPTTKKQLRSFLGLAGYYRKFVPNYAAIAVPLTDLTKKGEPNQIRWGEAQERAFTTLKAKLSCQPILRLPDVSRTFILRTDASETGVGAVLLQEDEGQKFPTAYASKKLLPRERAYSTIEKECLAVVWAILKFETYLYGKEFVLEVDHHPLLAIRRSKVANARILRWALALQPYRFRIEAIKGRDNVGADYLSRVT